MTPLAQAPILADSWPGVGALATWMLRQGFDLTLTSHPNGWRAVFLHRHHHFYPSVGQVIRWSPTPWRAVREAAWTALTQERATDYSVVDESPR